MANKPGEANFFPDVPKFPSMGTFQPVYGKFDLTTYIQGASDYEIMAFLVGKYNACLEAYGNITKLSTDTITACKQLQDWINNWFTNLDVQEEINKKLDSMVTDGSFGTLLHQTFDAQINQQTTSAVTAWLVANVTPTGSAVVVDKSLSIEGAAADAKICGNKFNALYTMLTTTTIKESEWESGEWYPNGSAHTTPDTIRTKNFVPFSPLTSVTGLNGYKILAIAFENGTGIGYLNENNEVQQISPGFLTSYHELPEKWQYKFMLYKPGAENIDISECINCQFEIPISTEQVDNLLQYLTVTTTLNKTNWESGEWYPNGSAHTTPDTIRTKNFVPFSPLTSVTGLNGYKILAIAFENGTGIGYLNENNEVQQISPGFLTSYHELPEKWQYKFMLYKPGAENIDISECINCEFKGLMADAQENVQPTTLSSPITITKLSNTQFKVECYTTDHTKHLTHLFTRQIDYQTINEEKIKTQDVWFADDIIDENGNTIMQGNTNFIHNLANENHTGYVGAGDGCTIANYTIFMADGKEFNPENLTALTCNTFSFITKTTMYLSSGNTQYTGVIPELNDSNQMIPESSNLIIFELKENNVMHHRNILTVVFNNSKYSELHAAMCCGFYPYFNKVLINDKQYSYNTVNSDFSITTIGDSINIKENGYVKANEVVMLGDNYKCTERIINRNPTQYNLANIRPWFPPNNDNRIKIYLMPVTCTISRENIADGDEVKSYPTGTVFDIDVYRTIDII